MRRSRRTPLGFTLIEVMIALAASGLVLLAARALLDQLESAETTLAADARDADATANGERALRMLVGRAEVSPDSVRRFMGDAQSASFDSWCDRPAGWMERCRVTLTLQQGGDSSTVTAVLSTGEALRLRTYPGPASFRFVAADSAGVQWLTSWGRSIAAPVALIVVHARDTVVVRIGERR